VVAWAKAYNEEQKRKAARPDNAVTAMPEDLDQWDPEKLVNWLEDQLEHIDIRIMAILIREWNIKENAGPDTKNFQDRLKKELKWYDSCHKVPGQRARKRVDEKWYDTWEDELNDLCATAKRCISTPGVQFFYKRQKGQIKEIVKLVKETAG
jgi:hypothetical protein